MQLNRPSALRFILAVTALLLAAIAQLLIGDGSFRWAITPLVTAMIAMAVAARRAPFGATAGGPPTSPIGGPGPDTTRERRFGLAAVMLGTALFVLAMLWFASGPTYTAAWYAYGASMVLLLVALPVLDGRWTRLALHLERRPSISIDVRALVPWIALAAILLLALALRLYHLDELPAGLWYDEADNLEQARVIRSAPGSTPVFVPSTNLPSLFLMSIAAVMEIAGISITTGRIVSVAFGLVGIVAVFLLARLALGPFLATIAAVLVAVMRWDINWSRIGMHGITVPLFAALAAYLTFRALRSDRLSDYGYAGAALGLGMWFYTPFRLFPLVVGFILLHRLLVSRPGMRRLGARVLLMAATALIMAAPVVQSSVREPDQFFSRTRATSVFSLMPWNEAIESMWVGLGKHALMFSHEGDANPRHNLPKKPMLDFLSGTLMVLGLGVALSRWREPVMIALPVWMFVMVLPGVITLPWEAPQSLRSIGVIPAVAMSITLALGALWWAGRSAPWSLVRRSTPVVVAAAVGVIAFANVNTYFGPQARDPEVYAAFSTDETLMARHMAERQNAGDSLLVSRQFKFSLIASLLSGHLAVEVVRVPSDIPIGADGVGRGVSVYLEPREGSVYRLLRTYYPDGVFQEVRAPGGGKVLFYSAVISADQLRVRQGLNVVVTQGDGVATKSVLETTEHTWFGRSDNQGPADVVWSGALHVKVPGEYRLVLDGNVNAQVVLDGRRLLWDERKAVVIEPAVGLHYIEVQARVEVRPGQLRLLWQPPEGELAPIGRDSLFHGTVQPLGLVGRFFKDGAAEGRPDALRVTPAMDAFYYDPVVAEPYLAVWEGTLNVETAGDQRFLVNGAGDVRLFIGGELTARRPPEAGVDEEGSMALGVGPVPITVEYRSLEPPSQFEVLWASPGRSLAPVPIERLAPAPQHMFRVISSAD